MSINSLCLSRTNKLQFLTLTAADSLKVQSVNVYWTIVKESTGVPGEVQPLLPVEDVMADLLLKNGRSRRRNVPVIATQLVKQFSWLNGTQKINPFATNPYLETGKSVPHDLTLIIQINTSLLPLTRAAESVLRVQWRFFLWSSLPKKGRTG